MIRLFHVILDQWYPKANYLKHIKTSLVEHKISLLLPTV